MGDVRVMSFWESQIVFHCPMTFRVALFRAVDVVVFHRPSLVLGRHGWWPKWWPKCSHSWRCQCDLALYGSLSHLLHVILMTLRNVKDFSFILEDSVRSTPMLNLLEKHECIPVGRVPPASVATTRCQYSTWGFCPGVGSLCLGSRRKEYLSRGVSVPGFSVREGGLEGDLLPLWTEWQKQVKKQYFVCSR